MTLFDGLRVTSFDELGVVLFDGLRVAEVGTFLISSGWNPCEGFL